MGASADAEAAQFDAEPLRPRRPRQVGGLLVALFRAGIFCRYKVKMLAFYSYTQNAVKLCCGATTNVAVLSDYRPLAQ